jgi:hypothetical protein
MKISLFFSATVSMTLSLSALADNYNVFVAQGYRWVSVDGPYACHTEEGAEHITKHHTDATELDAIQNMWCYYLIPGTIVQVIKEDHRRSMSQMRIAGVAALLWTNSRFLSRRPVRDLYGVIETPESTGLQSNAPNGGSTPLPSGSSSPRSRQ